MIEQILHTKKEYPPLLKEIQDPPSRLFVLGKVPLWAQKTIAIVGTRKATKQGLSIAKTFAYELSQHGCTIISGLALGIDAAAHIGALEGHGITVAVLANGLDSIYPRQHEQLAERIIKNDGCIISEYPEGTPPYPNQFLQRNRIVAGIAQATIVIEAPIRSGSVATAKLAIESGRDVFVVPGSIYDKNYEGSHMLLRNGARLVSRPEDIFEDLNIQANKNTNNSVLEDEISKKIFEIIKSSTKPLKVDTIIEMAHLEPSSVQESLTLLVLDGFVKDVGGLFLPSN